MEKIYDVRKKYNEETYFPLNIGDYGDAIENYNFGCIDDIIREIAESYVDTDYESLFAFAKDNIEWCDMAVREYGDLGDFMNIIACAEMLKVESDLDSYIEDSIKSKLCNYATDYIDNKIKPFDYTLFNTKCDIMTWNVANYISDMKIHSSDRLDDYIHVVETYIDYLIEHFNDLLKRFDDVREKKV